MGKTAFTGNVSANTKWIYERIKIRQLIEFLKLQDMIVDAKQHHNYIRIKYVTGITEKWYIKPTFRKTIIVPEDPYKGIELKIDTQFPIYIDDDEAGIKEKLFLIDKKKYQRTSFVNKSFIVQKLVQRLLEQGWHEPQFTHEQLVHDLQRLHNTKLSRNIIKQKQLDLYRPSSVVQPGLYILTHYNNHYKALKERWRPLYLYNAINRIIKHRRNINMINLLIELNSSGTFFLQPNLYRLIFRLVGVTKMQIYDPYPTVNKAVAFIMEGCKYYGYANQQLEQFLGTKFHHDELPHYDAILIDHKFRQTVTQEEFTKYSALADIKIFFCKRENRELFPTPTTILPIHTHVSVLTDPDYLLVYM